MKFARLLASTFVILLASTARSQDIDEVLAKIPAKARAKRNPFEGDPDAAAAGKKLFEQHCAECHGDSGQGTRRGPSLRVPQIQNATPGEIFWILTNGVIRRGMPSWSKLPEPQRWQIIVFVQSFQEHGAFAVRPSAFRGDGIAVSGFKY